MGARSSNRLLVLLYECRSNVRLSRAMAISAAALADDLGTEGSASTSMFRATTVVTGISLGFWFDNLGPWARFCKMLQGYVVWLMVSGCLLLYPLTEQEEQWPSLVTGCLYVRGRPARAGCAHQFNTNTRYSCFLQVDAVFRRGKLPGPSRIDAMGSGRVPSLSPDVRLCARRARCYRKR